MAKYKVKDLIYGGKYHDRFWNIKYNPNATVRDGLGNCTTLVYGDCEIKPVKSIYSADQWHKYLINGWKCVPYQKGIAKVGDIIEWTIGCHVARVIEIVGNEPIIGGSYYTGDHGRAYYNGDFDTRSFTSLQELSDFMYKNYPTRLYHEWSVEEESRRVGASPSNILVMPSVIRPVEEDKTRDQIYVSTNKQNVRDNDNNIIGTALSGFYNVYQIKYNANYIWYEVENNKYIAGVQGAAEYVPKEVKVDWEKKYLEAEKRIKELEGAIAKAKKDLEV